MNPHLLLCWFRLHLLFDSSPASPDPNKRKGAAVNRFWLRACHFPKLWRQRSAQVSKLGHGNCAALLLESSGRILYAGGLASLLLFLRKSAGRALRAARGDAAVNSAAPLTFVGGNEWDAAD